MGLTPDRSTRRTMGIVCYVLAGLLLAVALVVPVIGAIAALIVSAWGAAASGMTLGKGDHDPIGVAFEAIVNVVVAILDFLGPIPAILVALLTVVVEIGLLVGAAILIVVGRMLRGPAVTAPRPGPRRERVRR